MLIRLSNPTGLFVSLDHIKAHVVVGTVDDPVSDDDALLTGYIHAATRVAEERTGRALLPAEYEWRTDSWREPICIPSAPLREVTEIAYLDEDHAEQTLDPGDWYEVETHEGFEIRFTDAFSSPGLSDRLNLPVRVRFVAGYDEPDVTGTGDDPALVPDQIDRLIVMFLVAHWYARREPVEDGAVAEVPMTAKMLIEMRKIYR